MVKLHATVESGLSAKAEQDAVRTLFLDDSFYEIWGDRQEIDSVSHAFRCLYGGDVRIDEDRLDAFLFQCL